MKFWSLLLILLMSFNAFTPAYAHSSIENSSHIVSLKTKSPKANCHESTSQTQTESDSCSDCDNCAMRCCQHSIFYATNLILEFSAHVSTQEKPYSFPYEPTYLEAPFRPPLT